MTQILIVDDSPTMRKMIIAALRPLRATYAEAGNGLEAIEQLALARYDAMTLDLNMPDMHGFEVIRYVRSHDYYTKLPILVITTRSDDISKKEALESGADRYLKKPFAPDTIRKHVRALLRGQSR